MFSKRTLRKVFKTLATKDDFPGFYLTERVDSANNCHVLERVKLEIYHYVGGQDKCQWSDAQIEEAFKRYFLSTFETERKKEQGKYEEHKRLCRRQGRKREKVTRRTLALDKIGWDTQKKGQMAELLITEAYMSSEDSDDNGRRYVVKELSWESRKLSKRKKQLDKFYHKQHSQRTKERLVPRVRGEELSLRSKPDDCPEWACIDSNNISTNSE